eukprot:jgi/Botrbrau1/4544/Bobra.60_2s0032.1
MPSLLHSLSCIVWSVCVFGRWLQTQFAQWFMDTVLSSMEETVTTSIRLTFSTVTSCINNVFSWVVSAVDNRSYRNTVEVFSNRESAWQSWWSEDHLSTFNAIVASEREGAAGSAPTRERRRTTGAAEPRLAARKREPPRTPAPVVSETLWQRLWRNLQKRFGGGQKAALEQTPSRWRVLRDGSTLFRVPSGWAVFELAKKRGAVEDVRLLIEVWVSYFFDFLRWLVRRAACMPLPPSPSQLPSISRRERAAAHSRSVGGVTWEEMGARPRARRFQRSNSFSAGDTSGFMDSAADLILQAGYDLEEHTVITGDGYVIQMQRIPRHKSRDVVFFLHGVLDTSMGWVANGVTGSQAFGAWDQGFDVWLGNSRSNPPWVSANLPDGDLKYWNYTINELAEEDVVAQLDHIHVVKCEELGYNFKPGVVSESVAQNFQRRASADIAMGMRTSASDTALASLAAQDEECASPSLVSPRGKSGGVTPRVIPPVTPGASVTPDSAASSSASYLGTGPPNLERASMPLPFQHSGNTGGSAFSFSLKRLSFRRSRKNKDKKERGSSGRNARDVSPKPPNTPPLLEISPAGLRSASCSSMTPSPSNDNEALLSGGHEGADSTAYRSQRGLSTIQGSPSVSESSTSPGVPGTLGSLPEESVTPVHASKRTGKPSARFSDPGGPSRLLFPVGPGTEGQGASTADFLTALGPRASPPGPHGSASRDPAQSHPNVTASSAASAPAFLEGRRGEDMSPSSGGAESSAASQSPLSPEEIRRQKRKAREEKQRLEQQLGGHEPYRLRVVGHSLGGASLLIYAVTCRLSNRPHHIYRMILLTPAGFHDKPPHLAYLFNMLPLEQAAKLSKWLFPGKGYAVLLPSVVLRSIAFKITHDFQHIPALQELFLAGMRNLLNGDASQWDRAIQMPHYSANDMPALSFHSGLHLLQWIRTGRFEMYDYESAEENSAKYSKYNSKRPVDIAANYNLLDFPIDIVSGQRDGIINPINCERHYEIMKKAGCVVTLTEFAELGHLDFVFAANDELRHFVLSRLKARY